jgi:hypothetical protein
MKFIIDKATGELRTVYSDTSKEVIEEMGDTRTKRATNIEPIKAIDGTTLWKAALINGTVLGIFETRADAVRFEVKYLEKTLLINRKATEELLGKA